MSSLALPGMALLMLVWLVGALTGAAMAGGRVRRGAALATFLAAGAGTVLALAYLVAGAPPVALALPIGPPGLAMTLALDGLSGFPLVALMVVSTAAAAAALDEPASVSVVCVPLALVGLALCVLGADGFTVAAGLGLAVVALSAPGAPAGRATTGQWKASGVVLVAGLFALVCLVPAFGLLGGWDGGFAAARARPPGGGRAVAALCLGLLGAGAAAGLAPLHAWLPRFGLAVSGPNGALAAGGLTTVGLYLSMRLLFDLGGPPPSWLSIPLLLAGVASAVAGAWGMSTGGDIRALPGRAASFGAGLVAVGLGLAGAARAADMPPLAGLAAAAALLCLVAHALAVALLALGAGATARGTGLGALDGLGGLIHRMPVTTAAMLAGTFGLAMLPPGAGFAGVWLLLQALIARLRAGDGSPPLMALLAAGVALALGLVAFAAVRLVGIGYLGRPRTPDAAAAGEVGPPARWAMLGLAAAGLLVGLLPGVVLALARPAGRLLAGGGPPAAGGDAPLMLTPAGGGYAPLALAVLLALAGGLVWWVARRVAAGGYRRAPAWEGGGGDSPASVPAGGLAAQLTGSGFAAPLGRWLAVALPGGRETVVGPAPGETAAARLVQAPAAPAWRGGAGLLRRFVTMARGAGMMARGERRVAWADGRHELTLLLAVVVALLLAVAVGVPR